jgi:hypothetical protein
VQHRVSRENTLPLCLSHDLEYGGGGVDDDEDDDVEPQCHSSLHYCRILQMSQTLCVNKLDSILFPIYLQFFNDLVTELRLRNVELLDDSEWRMWKKAGLA